MNQSVGDQGIAQLRREYPGMAVVREINGQIVLDDQQDLAVFRAVGKISCRGSLDSNAERVAHFKSHMAERGLSGNQVVIVLANVDDVNGGPLAEALMPDADWRSFREPGQLLFAKGLADRPGIQELVAGFDTQAAEKLAAMPDTLAVVVIDHGVAEVFPA